MESFFNIFFFLYLLNDVILFLVKTLLFLLLIILFLSLKNSFVSKKVKDGKTNTHIKKLSEEELLQEIARISSGTVTQISINHAKELRKMCIKNIA